MNTRWLIRRDMPEVLAIEEASFANPWSEEDFLCLLRQRNSIGMVVEDDCCVLGFMFYSLHKKKLELHNFAVHPERRQQKVGHTMLTKLKHKLSMQRRHTIEVGVRESNLSAQLFFQSESFVAVNVDRGHYDDTGEDRYLLRFDLEPEKRPAVMPANRIAKHLT